MKKISSLYIPITLILILAFFYYIYHTQTKYFPEFKTCTAKTISNLNFYPEKVNISIIHKITLLSRKDGFDYIRGMVIIGGESYKINRTLQFRLSTLGLVYNHQYMVKLVQIFPDDTLPNNLAEKYITFLKKKEVRSIYLEKINDGLLLIGDTTGPSFICQYIS